MLKIKFGLSFEQYDEILERQGGGCGICGMQPRSLRVLAVDHDHVTGAVRGILCSSCNLGIGNLQDNPEIVLKAHDYLIRYSS